MKKFILFYLALLPLKSVLAMDVNDQFSNAKLCMLKIANISPEEISVLVDVVNGAYLEGERGICQPATQRIDRAAMTAMIEKEALMGLRIGYQYSTTFSHPEILMFHDYDFKIYQKKL